MWSTPFGFPYMPFPHFPVLQFGAAFSSYLLLVNCRCRPVEPGCFKFPTRCTDRVGSWTYSLSPPWQLTPVACSNVRPPIGWRSSSSVPVCFFWYRVSVCVLLCCNVSYPELEMRSVERGICHHSHVHNERTVPIIIAGCIAQCACAKRPYFFGPDFLLDAKISAIRP